jgi:magnesium transporter
MPMTQVKSNLLAASPPAGNVHRVVNCAAYAAGCRVADVDLAGIGHTLSTTNGFIRIGLYEPDEDLLRIVQREFGLHDLAIEDAHRAHQRPKLEQYHDSLFVVLRTAHLTEAAPRRVEFGDAALTHIYL